MTYALEVATSSPRPGRRFEPVQELALHQDALEAIEGLPGASRGLLVVPEYAGPFGIPDFTAYVGDIDRIRRRHDLDVLPVVNEIEAGILSAAHMKRPSSAEELAQTLGWPLDSIGARVRGLARRGALIETAPGRYVKPEPLEPGGRLYAIEAKVDDWRSALRQVRTYRVWADSYVLVMGPLSVSAHVALETEVRRDRGGLMVSGRWIVRPLLGSAVARRRIQAWELLAAATRAGLSSPAFATPIHA